MATYAELREKYVNGQGKEQKTQKREAPDNAQIVAGARQYLAQHQAENAGKWAAWQEVATARDNASAAARAAEEAQKKYDEYLLTDEAQSYVRQNQAAKGAQMMQGAGISTPYAAGTQQQAAPQKDQKAEALKAERDRLKNMMNAENDRYVMESDLAELATWTEEDRSNLDKYVGFRQTGITSGGYAVPAKEAYNNLVAKYGKEKVDQLAYTWQRDKNAKDTKALAERSAAAVKGNTGKAIWHSAATIPANLLGSVAGAYGVALDWATRDNRYSTLDPNNIGTMASVYSGAVRGQVAEDISGDEYDEEGNQTAEGGKLRQALSIGYQGAMSAADSIARAAAGGGGFGTLALAATGSFSQTVSEASKQGATPQQAIILGIGNAALEAATEKVPLDNILKAAKGGIKGAKAIAKEALRQAAIEATEEEISLFGSLLLEAAVLQEKSAYQQSIAEGIANGMTYEEAKEQADKAVWTEALNTAMVSAVAGGLSGGGSAIAGNVFASGEETATGGTEAAQKPAEAAAQPQDAQEQEQPDVAQAVVQELTQAQETEAQANAAQEQAVTNAAQSVAEQFPDRTQTEPKSQQQEQIDNATAAMLAENGVAQPEAEQNVGIKGTGAAEANFSGKAQYQDLLYEGNVQPDREGDVRPMEVPKTDLQGNPVSATAANVYGSQYTTDDLASAEESAIAKGELSYIKITNDRAAERASKTIESAGGWREAYMQWRDEVRDGKTSAEMAARGAMLLNHAAEVYEQTKATGDDVATKEAKQEWLNILMDVQRLGTNTAQGLQALRMIRELSPPDKLDFAVASVKRMVADMKLQEDITIDEGLLNEYRMAETDEQRDEIMGRIQQNVADQIPSTFLDKWTALRYMNMLGNLKTNVRNFAGNVGSMIAYRIKDQFAAGMESIASVFDKNFQRTKSHTVSKELLNFAKNDFNAIKSSVNGGGKYNERMTADAEFQQGVMDKRTVFKSNNAVLNAAMKPLEAYRRGTNWMMNNEYFGDEAFGRAAYARAMAGFLKANGVNDSNIENVNNDLLDRARTYAIKEAQEATFKDNTALANIVSKVQKSTGVVGQAIMPFTKTPANVLVRAVEFSPVGILDTAAKTAKMELSKTNLTNKTGLVGDVARSGEKITGADIVNSLAKNLTGTALFGLGALLWDQGLLSAGPSDDEEEATLDDLTGKQPYSLQFTGLDGVQHSYTMDWLSPVAMPMFMGAEFWKALKETNGTMTFADYEQLFTSIADPMIQMSMLQGLNDTLESIKWSDNNLGQFFLNAACSYLTQGITNTLIGQLERTTEENRTTTYVDENSNIPKKMQQLLGKTSQKIPGWDFQQMEYRNKFGATEENEGGLLYNVASPGYFGTESNDAVTQELYRLNENTTEKIAPPDIPKKVSYTSQSGEKLNDYQLTQEQYQKLAQTQGQTAKKILDQMVASSDYKKLTDDQKAYAIKAAYEFAQEQGKKAALPDYHSKAAEWVSKTKESDIQAFVTRGATQALNSAISSAVSNLGDGLPVTEATKADMEETYKAFANMSAKTKEQILDEASAETVKYLTARQSGATAKNYLDVTKNVKALGDKPTAAQKYGVVARTSGMSDGVKDALMKAYMPDYDPEDEEPNKTELKYDYIRQKMEMSPQEYAQIMKTYYEVDNISSDELKAKGLKKKNVFISRWIDDGVSQDQANELYNLLVNTSKNTRIDVVSWYENQ